jgi:hypothetical protein
VLVPAARRAIRSDAAIDLDASRLARGSKPSFARELRRGQSGVVMHRIPVRANAPVVVVAHGLKPVLTS